jgi:hypothetical protein
MDKDQSIKQKLQTLYETHVYLNHGGGNLIPWIEGSLVGGFGIGLEATPQRETSASVEFILHFFVVIH